MAGGVFAFVVLMIILLCVGIFGIAAGIVGIILFNLARKKGKKFGKPLTIVSAVVLTLSVLITALPVGYGVFIYVMNLDNPDRTPQTEIIIQEETYQYERFTADGVVYERVEIDELSPIYSEWEPAFSYVSKSIFGDTYGTYDKLIIENGFNIVAGDSGEVFCPVAEKEEVEAFYGDDNNYKWCYDEYSIYEPIAVEDDGQKVLDELLKTYKSKPETVKVKIEYENFEKYWFEQLSNDGVFSKNTIMVYEYNGKYYMEISDLTSWGDDAFFKIEAVEIDKTDAEKLIESIK